MSGKRIVIDLSQTDTKPYKTDNLIQAGAQKSFEELIEKILSDINISKCIEKDCQDNNKNTIDRVHNTILINGKRGMGKTSFILSIENAKKSASEEKILKDICSLGIIDPTLIETKEHVLLNIITLIKDKIEESIRCNKCDDKGTQYKAWKESLKKLAGGLSMLDGIGFNHLNDGMWDSPELILEKGLSNAKQGVDLEKNFHKFIDESLKIMEKKAFFLILDDIDTSLDKGVDILEILRKYLTSRKLIIAMLGDIDLYSTLVRQLQWEKMDSKKILKEYEFPANKEIYISQIEHLEEQYLTKVLKPENRIDLQNLLTLESKLSINTIDNHLTIVMQEITERVYLAKNGKEHAEYEYTLLTQSTRSILQILQAWYPDRKLNTHFIDRFKHTFYTTLKKKLEPHNLIVVPERKKFLNLLSVYILKENISRDNHLKLTPNFAKEDDNIVMLYLNMMANHLLKPQDYLSYFIKIGYALERYNSVVIANGKGEFLRFIDHIGLDNHSSALEISKKLLTTFKIDTNTHTTKPMFFGNLSLSKNNLKSIKDKSNLSLLMCRVFNQNGLYFNVLSIFNLIGLLADISNNSDVEKILTLNNSIRDFELYVDLVDTAKQNAEQEEDDTEDSSFDISNALKEELIQWAEKSKDIQQVLSVSDLAKIWIRFANNINEVESRSGNRTKNYSEILDLYWAVFLNSLYIWCEDKKGTTEINFKNPSESSKFFYEKLKKDERYEEKNGKLILKESVKESGYTLFDYLYECPIFNKDVSSFNNISYITFKIDFKSLFQEQQIEAIQKITNWKNKAVGTINTELSKQYRNLTIKDLSVLITQIKPKTVKLDVVGIETNKSLDVQ